jgi:hypothetical protein
LTKKRATVDPTYDSLVAALEPEVHRWEHASFALNTLDPYHCERGGWKPGRRLSKASPDAYAYGYDAEGRLLIAYEGQFVFLHVHEPGTVLRFMFDRHAIDFALRQKWPAADVKDTKALRGRAVFEYRGERLEQLKQTWKTEKPLLSRYEYDERGRLVRVHVSRPPHTDELEYDATDQLVRVVWRHPTGEGSERFRRPAREDKLSLLLPEIQARLVEQIPRVLKAARIRKPAYCVALSCNLEEAPHLLPPHVTVGLVLERDARLAKGGEYALDEIWRPDSMPGFDDLRLELRDPRLLELSRRANVARADDMPVLRMLRKAAAELQRRGLGDVLPCVDDFIVFAADVGGESGQQAARRGGPKAIVRRLRAAKLL